MSYKIQSVDVYFAVNLCLWGPPLMLIAAGLTRSLSTANPASSTTGATRPPPPNGHNPQLLHPLRQDDFSSRRSKNLTREKLRRPLEGVTLKDAAVMSAS